MCLVAVASALAAGVDLRKLSTRDLMALAREHGVDDELRKPGMVLEKSEIVAMLSDVIASAELREKAKRRWKWAKRIGLAFTVVATALLLREPLTGFLATYAFGDLLGERRQLAQYAADVGSPAAAFGIGLCGLIDVLSSWVRLSVVASWFVPRNSRLARAVLITSWTPSLPVSLGNVLSPGSTSGGWSVDISPIILLWLLRVLKRNLEAFVTARIRQRHSLARRERRAAARIDHAR